MTAPDQPVCRRCGADLGGSYRTDLVSAQQHHAALAQDGALMVGTILRATSACSWNCLAVLAAIEAGTDADAAVQVVAERERQVTAEGWTPEHDDTHDPGELAVAGVLYAVGHALPHELVSSSPPTLRVVDGPMTPTPGDPGTPHVYEVRWPWDSEWWKPKNPERDLVRGAALVAAEADRLVRHRLALARDRF